MPRPGKAAGSVALVTGANRGIGLAFVRELAARGAKKVYAGVRNPDALADEFAGLPAEVVPLDVTDPAAVGAAAGACPDVNLLVNNAGLFTNTRLVRTGDPDAARREMEVNHFGVLNMTRAFAPLLGANGGGYIVNVLSVAGAFPAPFMGGYSPAKAAALTSSRLTWPSAIPGTRPSWRGPGPRSSASSPRCRLRTARRSRSATGRSGSCPPGAAGPGSSPSTCMLPTGSTGPAGVASCATP
jgi:short chain dehydrogenase